MVAWMGRTALELMGQGGLGYSFDPLVADAADEYGLVLKDLMYVSLFPPQWSTRTHAGTLQLAQVRGLHQYIPLSEAIVPARWRRTVAELIPAPPLKRIMHIVDTLGTRSTEIFQAKKKALLAGDEALKEQVGEGKDLISVLRMFFSFPDVGSERY